MNEKDLQQIPVTNSSGQVVKMHLLKDLFKTKTLHNFIVIMAGGKGNRLRPLTENCPKPMLEIGSKPMLEIILDQFIETGFKKFYIYCSFRIKYINNVCSVFRYNF